MYEVVAMIGKTLFNKYNIVAILGQGGTSTVYLGENIILKNYWAIKVLSKKNAWLSLEMEEIGILKQLSHPMLPRIADMEEDNDNFYIVMDYLEGTNVSELLTNIGIIPQATLINWASSLLDVLNYLHTKTPPVMARLGFTIKKQATILFILELADMPLLSSMGQGKVIIELIYITLA